MKTILKLLAVLALVVAIVGCPQPQTQETNSWVIEPSITNWVVGDTPREPKGEALFGDVAFSYKKADGTTLNATPTEIGTYTLVASVAGTNNYTGLSKEVSFAILAPSEGLIYVENPDGTTASVTDIGTFTGTDLVIASSFNGKPVTAIGDVAFFEKTITSVVIPNSVTIIGVGAFAGCNGLESVEISASVTTIGAMAFGHCNSLVEIECNENNSSYTSENGVLYNKGITELITYPAGKIDKSFSIPDTVEKIWDIAFFSCESLESVEISDSVTTIGVDAFALCSALKSVEIPDSVETIKEGAFDGCSALESVVIGDGLTTMEQFVFLGCGALTSVTIPSNVTTLWDKVFETCDALTVYTAKSETPSWDSNTDTGWNTLWNSVSRPVVWGCTLSDGESEAPYVVSVTKTDTTLENADATKTLNAPYRKGYAFAGWTKTEDVATADEDLKTADTLRTAVYNDETVYAVWTKN